MMKHNKETFEARGVVARAGSACAPDTLVGEPRTCYSLPVTLRTRRGEFSSRSAVVVEGRTGSLVSAPTVLSHTPVMINLLHAGAVPFGYTSDKIESEFPGIEDCVSTGMSCHHLPDLRGE